MSLTNLYPRGYLAFEPDAVAAAVDLFPAHVHESLPEDVQLPRMSSLGQQFVRTANQRCHSASHLASAARSVGLVAAVGLAAAVVAGLDVVAGLAVVAVTAGAVVVEAASTADAPAPGYNAHRVAEDRLPDYHGNRSSQNAAASWLPEASASLAVLVGT